MQELKPGSKATDQIYGTMSSTMWSVIEPNTGILCACLPLLKVPIVALFPKLFARSNGMSCREGYPSRSPSDRPPGMARLSCLLLPTFEPRKPANDSWPKQHTPQNSKPSRFRVKCMGLHRSAPPDTPRPEDRSKLVIDPDLSNRPLTGAHGSHRSVYSQGGPMYNTHEMV